MAAVNMIAVNKFCDGHKILNNINLNIEKGEFVAVVGPSGSGKSTLLRLVAGLDSVSQGSILIDDQCVNKIPPAQRNMAMVFQNYALYPHMTVFDNMAYGLKMRGIKKQVIKERVEEVSNLLQLDDYLQRKPASLSGGQRQRVAMGRAIVRSPAVFLFDEPLSNLDAKLRTEMRHEIKKLHNKLNTTCLYVTHDQTEAMTLANRIVMLNKGCIEQVGTPMELYLRPATEFVASFIGHYPMNFLSGSIELTSNKIKTALGIELPLPNCLKARSSGDKVVVGIRPEHILPAVEPASNSIEATVDFIDDMGSDKILHLFSVTGNIKFLVRVFADTHLAYEKLNFQLDLAKANIFCQETGIRLGGWND
ncbi:MULTISPECIES: ABC transporter ATP-binding protein [Legionella]|uniref:ABC transporter ATP-binding protein n=1 Tax=Legionella TaxID=445 RepID=UPI000F8CB787|nr:MULTISPECIES: sn-glycerol-3-phosphate ABC transporter ATP-binding protein UgpC [Legionella]MCP0913464.1 sn-glycerol-3-phosphate ABC transporter ATP-binding protein UgpC [Legionella sp. 27cVA30]RUR11108.1 sn-glycerol-3-phosphate ABC transporter ATP-binding protein UgpC [Legionella septentrionalis]RUR14427.1 sn-glycerol-3-phosphate ABC transporter ATP-binding protein UgpC [Legionella septentrionalis]